MSASMTLNDSKCQRMPNVGVDSDKLVAHSEMVLSSFSTDAKNRPAMLSQIQGQKRAGTRMFATPVAPKRVSQNSSAPKPATENRNS